MSFSPPPLPPAAATVKVPDPPPPQQQPGQKPGRAAPLNPTIIGTPSAAQPLTLMGPGSLGTGAGQRLLG